MNDLDLCIEGTSFKVMPTIATHSPLNISETVDWLGSKGLTIGNGLWGIQWSRDR